MRLSILLRCRFKDGFLDRRENRDVTENSSVFVPNDIEKSLGVIAAHLEVFLDAWDEFGEQNQESQFPPALADFLPEDPALELLVLPEMIKVDLEFRWLTHNYPKRLVEYLDDFPRLSREKIPADLIYEEFYIRKQAGLVVISQEYLSAWPHQSEELRCLLSLNEDQGSSQIFQEKKNRILASLQAGQSLDEFYLIDKLGEGAFAHVYLARQTSMQRLVALKVSVERSEEPQTLAQLDHEFIVRVFDQRILPEKDLRLLYMQYLPGGTLLEVLREMRATPEGERTGDVLLRSVDRCLEKQGVNRPAESSVRATLKQLSWGETISWLGARLADGLDHAHRHGVLHRDIKPANVLLTGEGIPKLADFNISFSSQVEGAKPATYFGGSLAYMSPEQLEACHPIHEKGAEDLDIRCDLYSLGMMLWELLTGKRPFRDPPVDANWSAMVDEMIRIRKEGIEDRSDREFSHDIPSGLVRVLKKVPATRTRDAVAERERTCNSTRIVPATNRATDSLSGAAKRLPQVEALGICNDLSGGSGSKHRGGSFQLHLQFPRHRECTETETNGIRFRSRSAEFVFSDADGN